MKKVLLIGILLGCFFVPPTFADITIICNKNVKIDKLTTDQLREIGWGKKKSIDGQDLVFVRLIKNPEITEKFSKVVSRTGMQFKRHWKNEKFRGKSVPKGFEDISELINFIERTPNAIGYVDTENLSVNIKILEIVGKK